MRFSRWTFLGFIGEIEFPSSNFTRQLQSKLCTRQAIGKFDALLNCGVFRARPTCNVSKVARKHATLPNCCHIVMGHIYCVGSNSVHGNLTICKQCSIGAITLLEGRFATQRHIRYIQPLRYIADMHVQTELSGFVIHNVRRKLFWNQAQMNIEESVYCQG